MTVLQYVLGKFLNIIALLPIYYCRTDHGTHGVLFGSFVEPVSKVSCYICASKAFFLLCTNVFYDRLFSRTSIRFM